MRNSELKTILKLAVYASVGMFILWVSETVLFLIIEGWHLRATNPIEIWCDKIVTNMFQIALFLYIYVGIGLTYNLLFDETE